MSNLDQISYSDYKKEINQNLNQFYSDRKLEGTDERWSYFISNEHKCPNRISITGIFSAERAETETWFGVHPEISVFAINEELLKESNSMLDTKESFNRYVVEKENCWSWAGRDPWAGSEPGKARKLGQALLAQCILAITHEFWVKLDIDSAVDLEILKTDLRQEGIFFEILNKKNLKIYGRLSLKQCEKIEGKYALVKEGNRIFVRSKSENLSHIISWSKLHKELTCKNSLYSGVLTNVCDIEFESKNHMNSKFANIKIEVNKTTYATILGIGHAKLRRQKGTLYDSYSLTQHPFLETHKCYIEFYYKIERLLQIKYLGEENGNRNESEMIENIREYLKASFFPKPVSIAGNVVTSDNYLIYVKRGQDIENEGRLACSLTGYSEIYDPNVLCYKGALEADKPTICEQSGGEFSFGSEMAREAKAELGISLSSSDWTYSGLIFSRQSIPSEAPGDSSYFPPSATAFEIVGQARTAMSFLAVQEQQKVSIEREENEQILGIKLEMYKDKKEKMKSFLTKALEGILANKDLIILFALLYTFSVTYFISQSREASWMKLLKPSVQLTINLLINVAVVISFIVNVMDRVKKNKHKRTRSFLIDKRLSISNIWSKLDQALNVDPRNTSYLFAVMINIYAVTLIKEKNEDY